MADAEMAKMFGIPLDDRDKEKRKRWMKLLQMMESAIFMKMWMES
jgi:hypothetical protein